MAAAAIGQSLTRRGRNTALRIVTGHDMDGFAEHEWRSMAAEGEVAAIYMGKKSARFIQGRLMMHGADRRPPPPWWKTSAAPTSASTPPPLRRWPPLHRPLKAPPSSSTACPARGRNRPSRIERGPGMSRSFTPKVVTANRLREGDVVYLVADDRWTPHHHEAELIEDEAHALSCAYAARGGAKALCRRRLSGRCQGRPEGARADPLPRGIPHARSLELLHGKQADHAS